MREKFRSSGRHGRCWLVLRATLARGLLLTLLAAACGSSVGTAGASTHSLALAVDRYSCFFNDTLIGNAYRIDATVTNNIGETVGFSWQDFQATTAKGEALPADSTSTFDYIRLGKGEHKSGAVFFLSKSRDALAYMTLRPGLADPTKVTLASPEGCAGSASSAASSAVRTPVPTTLTVSFGQFAGQWGGHGRGFTFTADGVVSMSWRIYTFCGAGVPLPCDAIVNNQIINGGQATLVFSRADATAAYGMVTATTDSHEIPAGPIRLVLLQYGTGQFVYSNGQASATYCGPNYGALAPASFRATNPCGA